MEPPDGHGASLRGGDRVRVVRVRVVRVRVVTVRVVRVRVVRVRRVRVRGGGLGLEG